MSDNWIVQNLEKALALWNEKLAEIWKLLTTSPEEFRGGALWGIVRNVHGAVQGIGYSLLVLFFLAGVLRSAGSLEELKRPATAVRLLLRFLLAKAVLTHGMDLMLGLFAVTRGLIAGILEAAGIAGSGGFSLPGAVAEAVEKCDFWQSIPLWTVTILGSLFMTVLSFFLILTVYGRFFRLYLYTALSPIPLSAMAGEGTQSLGLSFLKSYAAVLLEGAVTVLGCVIFSGFAATPPSVDAGAGAPAMVWSYVGEVVFHMLILVGTVKASDRVVRDLMGL